MEEAIKNRLILILVILTVIFFMGTAGSCSNAGKLKSSRDKEMAIRLDLEEKMNKVTQDKASLEEKIKGLTQALDAEKSAHETTNKALTQEHLISQSLKDELGKVTKLKDALEEDLKEALATGQPATKR